MSQDIPVNPFQKALDDAKAALAPATAPKKAAPKKAAPKKAAPKKAAPKKAAPKKAAPKKAAPKKATPTIEKAATAAAVKKASFKKEPAIPSAYEKRNNITRPGADTQTGKFWKWCDQAEATKAGAVRATLIQKAVDAGMSKFTGATQYARWRAFNA